MDGCFNLGAGTLQHCDSVPKLQVKVNQVCWGTFQPSLCIHGPAWHRRLSQATSEGPDQTQEVRDREGIIWWDKPGTETRALTCLTWQVNVCDFSYYYCVHLAVCLEGKHTIDANYVQMLFIASLRSLKTMSRVDVKYVHEVACCWDGWLATVSD